MEEILSFAAILSTRSPSLFFIFGSNEIVFDGGEKSVVSLKIDDGEPFFLKNEMRVDTFAFNIHLKENSFISGWEIISPHIWAGPLEGEIKPGIHTITVKARDEYGQEHTGRKIFEVTPD